MIIGIDAMGGDYAPSAVVEGVVQAQKALRPEDTIVLIGDQVKVKEQLERYDYSEETIKILHASEVIAMDDQPTRAFSVKTDSSLNVGFRMLKQGKLDSFASAGNTGAMLVGAFYEIGIIKGLLRPTTTAYIPKENGGTTVLLDVGTNPDVKPDVLNQFASLGGIFAENILNIDNPRTALLNIGSEEKKGNILSQTAYGLLKENKAINFVGNIEGHDIFSDKCDVIVCDGFTGNVVLKQIEAFHKLMSQRYPEDSFLKRLNFENFGATPIIGANKPVLIAHGISGAQAFTNMVTSSKRLIQANLKEKIQQKLAKNIVL